MVVADDDQRVELGPPYRLPQTGDARLRLGVTRREPLGRQLGRDVRLRPGQQLVVGRRPALLVEKVANPVAIDKPRPILRRGVEHRSMRRADPEDELGHSGCSFLHGPKAVRAYVRQAARVNSAGAPEL